MLIDRKIQELSCDSVLVDNEKAAEDAMRVFLRPGTVKSGSSAAQREFPQLRNVSRGTEAHMKKKIFRCGNL